MKKPKFIFLWIMGAMLAYPAGKCLRKLAYHLAHPGPVSTAEARDMTKSLVVSQHPDANLCMVHYPKYGSFEVYFVGEVDCAAVQDRLKRGNSTYGVAALARMTFVRDSTTPDICYGLTKHQPYTVDCDVVARLIQEEAPPVVKSPSRAQPPSRARILYIKDAYLGTREATVLLGEGKDAFSSRREMACNKINHLFEPSDDRFQYYATGDL